MICLLTNQILLNQKMESFAEERIVIVIVVIISKRERMGENMMSCTHHSFDSDTSVSFYAVKMLEENKQRK